LADPFLKGPRWYTTNEKLGKQAADAWTKYYTKDHPEYKMNAAQAGYKPGEGDYFNGQKMDPEKAKGIIEDIRKCLEKQGVKL